MHCLTTQESSSSSMSKIVGLIAKKYCLLINSEGEYELLNKQTGSIIPSLQIDQDRVIELLKQETEEAKNAVLDL